MQIKIRKLRRDVKLCLNSKQSCSLRNRMLSECIFNLLDIVDCLNEKVQDLDFALKEMVD